MRQRVIVTGGSRGIGLELVNAFKRIGDNVMSVSRSDGVDLLNPDSRRLLNMDCDILVNCAGTQHSNPAENYPASYLTEDLEWIRAAFELCQGVYPYMKERGFGRIINIASIAGIQGTRNIIGYSMAKAALIEMTKCLSNEWAPYGITVNAVAPGYIETDMLAGLLADKPHAEQIKGRIPVGRFGDVSDIGAAVFFLASPDASYISGTTLIVDGGFLAR